MKNLKSLAGLFQEITNKSQIKKQYTKKKYIYYCKTSKFHIYTSFLAGLHEPH